MLMKQQVPSQTCIYINNIYMNIINYTFHLRYEQYYEY